MARVRYVRNVDSLTQLSNRERRELHKVTDRYAFRANDYYLNLIDWSDPDDPIRKIIVPSLSELDSYGELDASKEEANYVAPGCQHKYPHTALLVCTEICGAFCRFCFRKRLFMENNDEAVVDVSKGIEYIRNTKKITNVLLTGGDPLFLSTKRLERIITQVRAIPHVGIIRIGSKMPSFNPYRILDDPELVSMLSHYSTKEKRIYLMTHFNVPQEVTPVALRAINKLLKAGIILTNQTPLLRGVNDRPEVLAELMRKLSFAGVPPYYFFQCRPTEGNKPFALTMVEAYRLLEGAKKRVSGLAKRARLVMSHASGKVEIVGLTRSHMYLKYHRARHHEDEGRFLAFRRDDSAHWLDDLIPAEQHPVHPRGTTLNATHFLGHD